MQVNKYLFCGCTVEVKSKEAILSNADFSLFRTDSPKADYSLTVVRTDKLPEKSGECFLASERRNIFWDGTKKLYTAYFDTSQKDYVDFACKIDDSEIFVSYPGEMTETMIFDGMNLPDMLLRKGIGILHCSFVEYMGSAILFAGDKQVGKSTQAALWEANKKTETINGDRAAITLENGIFYAHGIPFCGTSKICKNKKMPIKAIVCLSQGTDNNLCRKTPIEAFSLLLDKFTYDNWDKRAVDEILSLVSAVSQGVPVYYYSCRKDKSAVETLESELLKL